MNKSNEDDENIFKEIKISPQKKEIKLNKNEEEKISLDVSAENDNNEIEWEYDIKQNEKGNKTKINNFINENKKINENKEEQKEKEKEDNLNGINKLKLDKGVMEKK